MMGLFAWVGVETDDGERVLRRMASALRVDETTAVSFHVEPGLALGVFHDSSGEEVSPIATAGHNQWLWLAGEIFFWHGRAIDDTRDTRAEILDEFLRRGVEAIESLDGEYQLAIWDRRTGTLTVALDRFAGLPAYIASNARGTALAPGVRGVLMAPDVSARPDTDAIREAVTFGGYRLGSRTNIRDVHMLPPAAVVRVHAGRYQLERYWDWRRITPRERITRDEAIEEIQPLWRRAVHRRLVGADRPGQTLSGGLDSRAILAEAAPATHSWTAITYGLAGSDDVRYARRAAAIARVAWQHEPLYREGWLDRRLGHVQRSDGLIELADLLHVEPLEAIRSNLDVNLSGFWGDVVGGPTYDHVASLDEALVAMPFYGTPIGWSWTDARERLRNSVASLEGLAPRFLLFEHKAPQAIARVTAIARPWVRVRRPFIDYAFVEGCQSLPSDLLVAGRLRESWLRRAYPSLFARVPDAKSGVPAGAAPWRKTVARGRRMAWRVRRRVAGRPFRDVLWSRSYQDEDAAWREPDARRQIEEIIFRRDSIASDVFGPDALRQVVRDWFEHGEGPVQVIGALCVFEAYHRGLQAHLRRAAAAAAALHWHRPTASC